MTQNELIVFAEGVLARTRELYEAHMVHNDLPQIEYVHSSVFENALQGTNETRGDNTLLLFAEGNYGLAVRDQWVRDFIHEHHLSDQYSDNTIFIFIRDDVDDNMLLSTLCHELMHYFFTGIDNETDAGQGYNEACTDHLAAQIFGDGYWTSYKDNDSQAAYINYYREFVNGSDDFKQSLLDLYMGIPKSE